MSKKKVLFVTQEMKPYTVLSQVSEVARRLPQHVQENGMEIRILMPRYGTINERRHRLHEVVRLSGMNIIVDDDDYPLIIKVASLQEARMQVYFLDNEDFFKRKQVFENKDGKPFEDNADRMVFFCKGVMETVKKFGWPPDVIHCHGWMTSLVPLYLKKAYSNEPLFQNTKTLFSVYNETLEDTFDKEFITKAKINNLNDEDLSPYQLDGRISLHEGAVTYADGVVLASEETTSSVLDTLKSFDDKPVLEYPGAEDYLDTYLAFYQTILSETEVAE